MLLRISTNLSIIISCLCLIKFPTESDNTDLIDFFKFFFLCLWELGEKTNPFSKSFFSLFVSLFYISFILFFNFILDKFIKV